MYHTADSFKQFLDSSHFFFKVGASLCIKKQQYPVEKEQSYIAIVCGSRETLINIDRKYVHFHKNIKQHNCF